MSSPFNPPGGNPIAPAVKWVPNGVLVSTFVPFPATSNGSQEVPYDDGGYGDGGYDSPALPPVFAPTTNWTVFTNK